MYHRLNELNRGTYQALVAKLAKLAAAAAADTSATEVFCWHLLWITNCSQFGTEGVEVGSGV